MWYVNADGMEGWVPSDVLRLMNDEDLRSSSGQSTPIDLLSAEASADNSEMSDDGGECLYHRAEHHSQWSITVAK